MSDSSESGAMNYDFEQNGRGSVKKYGWKNLVAKGADGYDS